MCAVVLNVRITLASMPLHYDLIITKALSEFPTIHIVSVSSCTIVLDIILLPTCTISVLFTITLRCVFVQGSKPI